MIVAVASVVLLAWFAVLLWRADPERAPLSQSAVIMCRVIVDRSRRRQDLNKSPTEGEPSMIEDAEERVYHAVGVAETIEGANGLRIDVDAAVDDLPQSVWVRNGAGLPQRTGVLGHDPDGWVVVADIPLTVTTQKQVA